MGVKKMSLKKVGILSPGDMGNAVGRVLIEKGMPVLTCLKGRSERTRSLAKNAGIIDVGTYEQLVLETDLILSILPPSEASRAAAAVADALKCTGKKLIYVDCNAIAPKTVQEIGKTITKAGSLFIDAGIIGPPPSRQGKVTKFYASGEHAELLKELANYGLDIRVIGTEIGQASGIKMTYAALTKGVAALSTELLVAAWRMGLYGPLTDEFRESQPGLLKLMENHLPIIPSKSRRWIGEMEEIAKTFEDLGLTPMVYIGIADLYRFVGESSLADETPENRDRNRTLAQMIEVLAAKKE